MSSVQPKIFYILSEEKPIFFYDYLNTLYSTPGIKICWDKSFKPEIVKNFYPSKNISFYPILFPSPQDKESSYCKEIGNFVNKNQRIEFVVPLLLFSPHFQNFTFSYPALFADKKFKNGIGLKPDDYKVIIENFILTGIHGEEELKSILRNIPCNKNLPLPFCTFRIEENFLENLILKIDEEVKKIYNKSEEASAEKPDLDINIGPEKREFKDSLPEIIPGDVEDYFFVEEPEFNIDKLVKEKVDKITNLILTNSMGEITNLKIEEWKDLKEKFEKEKNEKKDNLKEYLRNNYGIKSVRQELEEKVKEIFEKLSFPLDLNYFSSELQQFLLERERLIKKGTLKLKEEISFLNEIKRRWKPYLIFPFIFSLVLFLPVYLKIKKYLFFLRNIPQKFLFSFCGLFFLSLSLSFVIRWLKVKKQFKKCEDVLEELRNISAKNLIKGQIEKLSSKIMKKKFMVKDFGNLVTDYQNLMYSLDNYTSLYKNSGLNLYFTLESSLLIKTETKIALEDTEGGFQEEFYDRTKELYDNLWKFPDCERLKRDFLKIITEFLREKLTGYTSKNYQKLLNEFENILNSKFYELLPLEKNKYDRLDTSNHIGIVFSKHPQEVNSHPSFRWKGKIEWPYDYRILYFDIFPWRK